MTTLIEYRTANFSTVNMIEGVSIERFNSDFQKSISHRRLPLKHDGLIYDNFLNPVIRFIDQLCIPSRFSNVVCTGMCVEPCIQTTSTSENSSSRVDNPIFRYKPLRRGRRRRIGKCLDERCFVGYILVSIGSTSTFEEEYGVVFRQSCCKWAT